MPTKDENYGILYAKMLNFLSYRRRTEHEIRTRLRSYKMGIYEDELISSLEEDGYIDDSLFAKQYIEEVNSLNKPQSILATKMFLRKKGVSEDIIDLQIQNLDPDFEFNSATKLAKKKLSTHNKQKLIKYLLQKGFSYSTVFDVIDSLPDLQ